MKKYSTRFFDYKELWPVWIDKDRHNENQEEEFLTDGNHWNFYDAKKTK